MVIGGIIPGFMVPALMGIVGTSTRTQWLTIFLISACVIFVSVGFFVISIRPEVQEFDDVAQHTLASEGPSKTPWDMKSELSQHTVPPFVTPLPASEFAAKTWPSGASNTIGTVWHKIDANSLDKILLKALDELASLESSTAISDKSSDNVAGCHRK